MPFGNGTMALDQNSIVLPLPTFNVRLDTAVLSP
jgi:hypothetical protein